MTCVNLYDVAAPTCTRIVATILLYYCATALLYDSRDWKQLKRDINAWLLYYCTTAQQNYCTTQGIDNNLKLYINSSLLWVYNCKITLLDHTKDWTELQLDIHSSLLYYCTTDYYCTQARPLALRELCVTIAWALREAALRFVGGTPTILKLCCRGLILWFGFITVFLSFTMGTMMMFDCGCC